MKKFLLVSLLMGSLSLGVVAQDIITETPAGTLYNHVSGNSGKALRIYQGGLASSADGGYQAEFVINGSEIYIHNIVSQHTTLDSWIKGTLDSEGNATFTFPQPAIVNGLNYSYYNMVTLDESNTLVAESGENNVLHMTWDGKTLRQIMPLTDASDKRRFDGTVAVTNAGGVLTGYGDQNIIYNVIPEELPAPGADAVYSRYGLTGLNAWNEDQSSAVEVAVEGDKLWIKGLYPLCPDAWACGTIEGDKVTFMTQPLGLSSMGYYMYLFGAAEAPKHEYTWAESLVFNRAGDGSYTTANPFMFNFGSEFYVLSYGYYSATLKPLSEETPTPADPTDVNAEVEDGLALLEFELPAKDAAGNPIDTSKLFYNIFLDGELFEADELYGFSTPTADIPYGYSDPAEEMLMAMLDYHVVIFFGEPHTIGVQAVYKDGDEVAKSAVVEWKADGVSDVTVPDASAPVLYFNLQGVEVKGDLAPGIYIRRQGMATSKVYVK